MAVARFELATLGLSFPCSNFLSIKLLFNYYLINEYDNKFNTPSQNYSTVTEYRCKWELFPADTFFCFTITIRRPPLTASHYTKYQYFLYETSPPLQNTRSEGDFRLKNHLKSMSYSIVKEYVSYSISNLILNVPESPSLNLVIISIL